VKNEINYNPQKEPTFSEIIKRQAETDADFTYSIFGNVISIVDLNLGNRSVTNDIERVLRKIEYYHQGSIVGFKIMYRDSEGVWDGIEWNGEHALFFALRETVEERARNKLLDRK
jgi:hypothetical protein